jgi:hypothetical protein
MFTAFPNGDCAGHFLAGLYCRLMTVWRQPLVPHVTAQLKHFGKKSVTGGR